MSGLMLLIVFCAASTAVTCGLTAPSYLHICKVFHMIRARVPISALGKCLGIEPEIWAQEALRQNYYFRHCCEATRPNFCGRTQHDYVATYRGLLSLFFRIHRKVSLYVFLPAYGVALIAIYLR